MDWLSDYSPIVACSTGRSENSALAVIRLSGFNDLSDIQPFLKKSLKNIKPRFSYLTKLIRPSDGSVVDEVLFTFFKAPHSFTGENVLEVSCHGNQFLIESILENLTSTKEFRFAHPGEFSYRALRNQKLTLSQVEGLDLILNSSSNAGTSQGLKLLDGQLHKTYTQLHSQIIKLRACVELAIDFSEDVGQEEINRQIQDSFNAFLKTITTLKNRSQSNSQQLINPSVVIAGPTNAGKSTLFNYLIRSERSIVSGIAGTTRDYISERVYFEGNSFQFVDTAGFRESSDEIESIGIDRGLELFRNSFFKLLVINPVETTIADLQSFLSEQHVDFILFTHFDSMDFLTHACELLADVVVKEIPFIFTDLSGSIGPISKFSGPIEPRAENFFGSIGATRSDFLNFCGPIEPLSLSELTGSIGAYFKNAGSIEPFLPCEELSQYLFSFINYKYLKLLKNNPIFVDRQAESIKNIFNIATSIDPMEVDVAILSHEINILSYETERLIGLISPNEVLSSVFSNFCIGK